MSIMRCDRHGVQYDSDFRGCFKCENEPEHVAATKVAEDWQTYFNRLLKLQGRPPASIK